jgi:hypothetical protein
VPRSQQRAIFVAILPSFRRAHEIAGFLRFLPCQRGLPRTEAAPRCPAHAVATRLVKVNFPSASRNPRGGPNSAAPAPELALKRSLRWRSSCLLFPPRRSTQAAGKAVHGSTDRLISREEKPKEKVQDENLLDFGRPAPDLLRKVRDRELAGRQRAGGRRQKLHAPPCSGFRN